MKLQLADCPLKHLLHLFVAKTPIQVRELGDTWHPSSGYVDEVLVAGMTTVAHLQAHSYDFAGLIYFEAELAGVLVRYHLGRYELSGPAKAIKQLLGRLEELNAYPEFQPKLQVLTS